MDFISYLEHVTTYYDQFISRLDQLYKEAKLVDMSNSYEDYYFFSMDEFVNNGRILRMNGFCVGDEPGVLYLNATIKIWNGKQRILTDVLYPVENRLFYNQYTFGNGSVISHNKEAMDEAIELVKEFSESGILNIIEFATLDTTFKIEPKIDENNAYISIKTEDRTSWFFPTNSHPAFLFSISTKNFVDSSLRELKEKIGNVEIPKELIPVGFKKLYQNRNLELYHINNEEQMIEKKMYIRA